jgi:predicted negative regulator of RcsB-dependent stress response
MPSNEENTMKKTMKFFLFCCLSIFSINLTYASWLQKQAEKLSTQAKRLKKTVENVVGKETVKSVEEKAKEHVGKIPGQIQEKFSGKKESPVSEQEVETSTSDAAVLQEQSAVTQDSEAVHRNPGIATY